MWINLAFVEDGDLLCGKHSSRSAPEPKVFVSIGRTATEGDDNGSGLRGVRGVPRWDHLSEE